MAQLCIYISITKSAYNNEEALYFITIILLLWSRDFYCLQVLSKSRSLNCEHLVAVLNDVLCMTCSLFMLVEDARGDHTPEPVS